MLLHIKDYACQYRATSSSSWERSSRQDLPTPPFSAFFYDFPAVEISIEPVGNLLLGALSSVVENTVCTLQSESCGHLLHLSRATMHVWTVCVFAGRRCLSRIYLMVHWWTDCIRIRSCWVRMRGKTKNIEEKTMRFVTSTACSTLNIRIWVRGETKTDVRAFIFCMPQKRQYIIRPKYRGKNIKKIAGLLSKVFPGVFFSGPFEIILHLPPLWLYFRLFIFWRNSSSTYSNKNHMHKPP